MWEKMFNKIKLCNEIWIFPQNPPYGLGFLLGTGEQGRMWLRCTSNPSNNFVETFISSLHLSRLHLIKVWSDDSLGFILLRMPWVSEWVKSLSHVRLFATPWTVAHQAPPSMEFSRQEYWSGVPFPSRGSSRPGDWTRVSRIAGRRFSIWATSETPKLGKEYVKAIYCHPACLIYMQSTSCVVNVHQHSLNTAPDEAQAGIKIAGRNINNHRYAHDTTLMAESEEELKDLWMRWKRRLKKLV